MASVFTGQEFVVFVANFTAYFCLQIGGRGGLAPVETYEAPAFDCSRKFENRKIMDVRERSHRSFG